MQQNLIVLHYAYRVNELLKGMFAAMHVPCPHECLCGYYIDNAHVEGYTRVLSLNGGEVTIRIPDDLDVGNLPELLPNKQYNDDEMWARVKKDLGLEKMGASIEAKL